MGDEIATKRGEEAIGNGELGTVSEMGTEMAGNKYINYSNYYSTYGC